ncbi:MD-2-related lipid-recognition domain [Arabidopsis suecica]|uniref:MD-2-related lipid-recognition domain n=1 Tax=Arabidopsis suecica TaxID=45249 RepID=A0A8T2CJF0_ARASU|nr:MD-2-related lipid-recognition domain [Arabidopsis suecica]
MVISHIQPLLLLACLFFLPALHAVDFKYCNGVGYHTFSITKMEFSPDASTITMFAFAYGPLSNLNVAVARKLGGTILPRIFYNFCKLVSCPILPGSIFVFTLPEIPEKQLAHEELMVIWSYPSEEPRTEIAMCVYFDYPTSVVSA